MPVPERIRVKISPEAADFISLARVVTQDIPLNDLIRSILSHTGGERTRVRETLNRGLMVTASSRYRWEPLSLTEQEAANIVQNFPQSEPQRLFQWDACEAIVIANAIAIEKLEGMRRRLLHSKTFWQAIASHLPHQMQYVEFHHGRNQDRYRASLPEIERTHWLQAANLLRNSTLRTSLSRSLTCPIDFFTSRSQ